MSGVLEPVSGVLETFLVCWNCDVWCVGTVMSRTVITVVYTPDITVPTVTL